MATYNKVTILCHIVIYLLRIALATTFMKTALWFHERSTLSIKVTIKYGACWFLKMVGQALKTIECYNNINHWMLPPTTSVTGCFQIWLMWVSMGDWWKHGALMKAETCRITIRKAQSWIWLKENYFLAINTNS